MVQGLKDSTGKGAGGCCRGLNIKPLPSQPPLHLASFNLSLPKMPRLHHQQKHHQPWRVSYFEIFVVTCGDEWIEMIWRHQGCRGRKGTKVRRIFMLRSTVEAHGGIFGLWRLHTFTCHMKEPFIFAEKNQQRWQLEIETIVAIIVVRVVTIIRARRNAVVALEWCVLCPGGDLISQSCSRCTAHYNTPNNALHWILYCTECCTLQYTAHCNI